MKAHPSILESVGRTPLLRLNRIGAGLPATVLLKAEFANPLGSVKDRVGRAMIADAEASGVLRPGATIVEPTSGNTGIALAFVAAACGYPLILTMPESMSLERRTLPAMLGADLVLTPGSDGMGGAMARAEEIHRSIPGSWMPRQFENPSNPAAHRRTTAREIWDDTDGRVDIFVAAVGTGGTITGVGEYLKERRPQCRVVAVEPAASPVIRQTLRGEPVIPGPHKIQGTGAGFVPRNLNLGILDDTIGIPDDVAIRTARLLASREGILAGISTGANVWAALTLAADPANAGKTIVTIGASTGERYLSTPLADEARSRNARAEARARARGTRPPAAAYSA